MPCSINSPARRAAQELTRLIPWGPARSAHLKPRLMPVPDVMSASGGPTWHPLGQLLTDSVEKGSGVLGLACHLSICETAFSFFTYSFVMASVALAMASHR
jgi:hypothetical protein